MESTRHQLISLIQQWNENRLDLFNLSFPDENDEFHGVMRFYYQEPGEKVLTKCVRVSSTATTIIVLEALIAKFRPDLLPSTHFLTKFSIWEVHENGDERQLEADEYPLVVQLTWHKDDREGRFLFKLNDKCLIGNTSSASADSSQADDLSRNSKRFSKRKREKELRKKYQNQKHAIEGEVMRSHPSRQLYDEVPPTTFTRTISNPEAVMKKRREQKIENRLRQIQTGGYVKIFSGDLDPSRPYVTLLVGAEDRAYKIIRDTLAKLGGEYDRPAAMEEYCLVEITLPNSTNVSRSFTDLRQLDDENYKERFLQDDETPFFEFEGERINHIFAIRRRPKSLRNNFKHPQQQQQLHDTTSISSSTGTGGSMYQQIAADYAFDPILVPLDSQGRPIQEKAIPLRHGITEIGSDPRIASFIIRDPTISPKHCIINFTDGLVSVTPLDGILEVNGIRAESTQQLRDGFVLRIGGEHAFRFHLSQRQNLPSSTNYANSPIFPRGPSNHSERPKQLDIFKNDRKSFIKASEDSMMMEETTFGVIDGQVMQRSKSTDALYQPPPISSTTTPTTIFTPRTIDRIIQSSMRPPTYFPETTIQNLPAIIELYDHNVEDEFLHFLISEKSHEIFPFRLTPTFMIYMVLRYRISPITYRQGISLEERRRFIVTFLDKTIERCFHIIHINLSNKALLAFWLSNCSELLHIISSDKEIASIIGEGTMGKLKTTVEKCYDLLVETTRVALQQPMSSFLKVDLDDEIASEGIIRQLEELVQVIRKCHLNAALTIQLFSQLFYFISMYGFNWLITTREGAFYLSRQFGVRLRTRLQYVCQWAEKQGLELAAECHLDRLQQTVNLLTTPKTIDQIASLGATCYKLNSLQVKYLLENYVPEVGEPRASKELVMEVSRLAESQADVMSKSDGFPIQLEENPQLQLSFVFPNDGYFVEDFKGIPAEMSDFIASLQAKGICRLIPQIGATGSWTIHMNKSSSSTNGFSNHIEHSSTIGSSNGSTSYPPYNNNNNSIPYAPSSSQASTVRAFPTSSSSSTFFVLLQRFPGVSLGLSIVAAQGIGDNHCGIYVKNVVPNSTAHRDGRLEKGDQLLAVNDQSLIGISQEEAAKRISSAGSDVRFEVAKRAAYYNGIIDSLEKTSNPNTPAAPFQPTNFPPQQSMEPLLHRHTRSASTSELFANQADNVSLASMSHQHGVPSGSRLPPHYKTSNRPAVVQPQRPGAAAAAPSPGPYRRGAISPTPLYSQIVPSQQRSASTVPFNSSTMPKQTPTWLENYSNLPSIGETSYPTRAPHIPHSTAATNHYRQLSSSGSSPLPAPPLSNGIHNHFTKAEDPFQKSHYGPAPVKPASSSGRLSAPLFDHPTRSFVEPQILSVEALDRELDAIESKGSMMTIHDKERYHELLKKISELRGPAPLGQSRSTSDFIGANGISRPPKDKHLRNIAAPGNGMEPQHRVSKPDYILPFMNEMATKLENKKHQQQRPATLPKPDSLATTSSTTFSTSIQRPQISHTEKLIDDVTQQFERINAIPLTPSTPSTSAALPRPAMRDNSVSPEDRSKKRVQFSDTIEDVKENDGDEDDEEEEQRESNSKPHVKVVGKNEVYNDPRQRRLNEIQQKTIKPATDGANLAFREKMKMFASQFGESTPISRQKASSAQREIEQSSDST